MTNVSYAPKAEPVPEPMYAGILAEAWARQQEEDGPKEFAVPDTSIRHSWAGKCSRALYYNLIGEEASNPPDLAGYWAMGIGTGVHEIWQKELQNRFDNEKTDVEIEVKVHVPECDSSGHIDAVITRKGDPVWKDCIELKTINGFGYKMSIGGMRKPAEGPRHSALVQGSVNAYGIKADRLIIVYLPMEAISKGQADRYNVEDPLRYGAEWHYMREEYEPIALREVERWQWLLDCRDRENPPPRWVTDPSLPDRSIVINPRTGDTQNPDGQRDNTWECGYCNYQDICIGDQ